MGPGSAPDLQFLSWIFWRGDSVHLLSKFDQWPVVSADVSKLVMPATNAASDRSFSAVRRIKTHVLNDVAAVSEPFDALACSYKDCTNGLELVGVANSCIAGNDHRKHVFGTEFKSSDQFISMFVYCLIAQIQLLSELAVCCILS